MAKYYISSGDFQCVIVNESPREAAQAAFLKLPEFPMKTLSKYTQVSEHGFESEAEDDYWCCTIDLLQETNQADNFKLSEWL